MRSAARVDLARTASGWFHDECSPALTNAITNFGVLTPRRRIAQAEALEERALEIAPKKSDVGVGGPELTLSGRWQ